MSKESEFTKNNPDVDASLWESTDAEAAEYEVGVFLGGLVRLIKPKLVIETGCYKGDTSEQIVRALGLNEQFSEFVTCDTNEEYLKYALRKIKSAMPGPNGIVNVSMQTKKGIEIIKSPNYNSIDLAFVDSGYTSREEEIHALIPKLSKYGIIVLHDTASHHESIHKIQFKFPELSRIYLNTPRGLTLFQRNFDNLISSAEKP